MSTRCACSRELPRPLPSPAVLRRLRWSNEMSSLRRKRVRRRRRSSRAAAVLRIGRAPAHYSLIENLYSKDSQTASEMGVDRFGGLRAPIALFLQHFSPSAPPDRILPRRMEKPVKSSNSGAGRDFSALPREALAHVFSHLLPADRFSFFLTSKMLSNFNDDDQFCVLCVSLLSLISPHL